MPFLGNVGACCLRAVIPMNCPLCDGKITYQGLTQVECDTPDCPNWDKAEGGKDPTNLDMPLDWNWYQVFCQVNDITKMSKYFFDSYNFKQYTRRAWVQRMQDIHLDRFLLP